MHSNKGFTLLELLIAAAIIGSLVVLATSSYRSNMAETYLAAAKGQTEMLGEAARRFVLENRVSSRTAGKMETLADSNDRSKCKLNKLDINSLIYCEYVENSGWDNPYFNFYICTGNNNCSASSTVTNKIGVPLAYMKGTGHARMPDKYGENYRYWVGTLGTYEVLP